MINKFNRRLKKTVSQWKVARFHQRIHQVLSSQVKPKYERSERDFQTLQRRFQPLPEYGYDPVNVFKRACERAVTVTGLPDLGSPGLKGLDLATGDGMLGVLLQAFGQNITLSDQEDWRADAAKSLPMVLADCCDSLPMRDEQFDFVTSFNAFEHFPDPTRVMNELKRVTRAGGLMYFNFGPLYCSPWGLHAYRTLRMPYSQFLFSKAAIDHQLDELGIWDLGKQRTQLQYVNMWRPKQYEALWLRPDIEILSCNWHKDVSQLDLVLEYPECFSGQGLTLDDLVISSVTVVLRKR